MGEIDDGRAKFSTLQLVTRGESKEIRRLADGRVAIRLLPTLYSFTHNRSGVVHGTELERFRAARTLTRVIKAAGVAHAYEEFDERHLLIIAKEVQRPPPIEVVVKAAHVGTPKHRYYGFDKHALRDGSAPILADGSYPAPYVRFDWRNPMWSESGERLADETMPEPLADLFIDVAAAQLTAMTAWTALDAFLSRGGVRILDVCFFLDASGTVMFGEVSPDCCRLRVNDRPMDKDIWRKNGSPEGLLAAWRELNDRLEALT